MKTIKTILAIILLSFVFVSCTPTSLEDEDTQTEILATGGDDTTEVDKDRD